jgi:hypothetical protein
MFMKCRECGKLHFSEDVRRDKRLTYSVGSNKWHDCIDGRGSGKANTALDNDDTIVLGYDGCLGWP